MRHDRDYDNRCASFEIQVCRSLPNDSWVEHTYIANTTECQKASRYNDLHQRDQRLEPISKPERLKYIQQQTHTYQRYGDIQVARTEHAALELMGHDSVCHTHEQEQYLNYSPRLINWHGRFVVHCFFPV
jgi:hypothetical protein